MATTPTISRELRKIDTLPYDELPHVIFKEEIKFLYEDKKTLRSRLEAADSRQQRATRETKLKLSRLRDEVVKQRNHTIVTKSGPTRGYELILNVLNGITRSL